MKNVLIAVAFASTSVFGMMGPADTSIGTQQTLTNQTVFELVKGENEEQVITELKHLKEAGVDINEKDEKGRSLLFYAFAKGKEEVAKYLIENGANINEQFRNGYNPLVYAIFRAKPGFLDFLLNAKVDVNQTNVYDCTPLFIVKAEILIREKLREDVSELRAIERILLNYGAELDSENIGNGIRSSFTSPNGVVIADDYGVVATYKSVKEFKKAGGMENILKIVREKRYEEMEEFGGEPLKCQEVMEIHDESGLPFDFIFNR